MTYDGVGLHFILLVETAGKHTLIFPQAVYGVLVGERSPLLGAEATRFFKEPAFAYTRQIKQQILSGQLHEGDALPSIRLLAKELRISVITTKRAYEDLEAAGFIVTQPGRGSFVAAQNPALVREEYLKKIEGCLQGAVDAARTGGIGYDEVSETLRLLWEG